MWGIAMADETPAKHLDAYKWKPGQSANPAGRPKGARSKLGEAFLEALHNDFNEHGVAAVEQVRMEKPDQYLKVIASLMPKELTLNMGDDYSEMSDDELVDRIRRLQAAITPFLSAGTGGPELDAIEASGQAASLSTPTRCTRQRLITGSLLQSWRRSSAAI